MDVELSPENTLPLKLIKPAYVESRGEKHLLIWPSRPFWMVCDKEARELVELAEPEDSFDSLYKRFKSNYPESTLTRKELRGFLDHLKLKGLVEGEEDEGDEKPKQETIENVTINITNRCNLSCITCYNQPMEHGQDLITSEDIDQLLSSLKELLGKKASFAVLGGEPLLRFNETLRSCLVARKYGLKSIISTNGTLLTPDMAKKLKKAGVDLQISLDGATAGTNDRIRGKGSFEKAKAAAALAVKKRVHAILSMVVCQENIHELEDFIKLGEAWGTKEVRFIPLKRIGKGESGPLTPPSLAELLRTTEKLITTNRQYRKKLLRDYFTILAFQCTICNIKSNCGTGLKTMFLDGDGWLYPCPNHCYPEFRFGHVQEDRERLKELWLDSPVLRGIREGYAVETVQPCSGCHLRYWCAGGCRGESYAFFKETGKLTPNCRETKKAILEMMWILGDNPELRPLKAKEEHF